MSLYSSEYEFKISFEDLDPMYVVWHGNYMRYMEQARCDMLEKLHYTYIDMKNDGYAYPVAKMTVKYIKPARFMDNLVMKLDVTSLEPSFNIKYRIYNKKTNEKIFEAKTMQICFDIKKEESVYTAPQKLIRTVGNA